MSDGSTPKKKVVKVESRTAADDAGAASGGPAWTPAPEAKSKATRLRIFAWAGWLLAIAVEAVLIFWVLRQPEVNMWLLIGGIVLTGVLASVGSVLWKKANRLDPASKKDQLRFFVQNQLGAIMSAIAFLPLIVLILTNKNMDGKQKAIAGGIAGVVALVAIFAFGADYSAPSQEQYAEETAGITALTGKDEVFWTKSGSVFHVCEAVPDVNKESKDGNIYQGTVAEAHAQGKDRLTKRWENEALNYCGFAQEQVDAARTAMESASADTGSDGVSGSSTSEGSAEGGADSEDPASDETAE